MIKTKRQINKQGGAVSNTNYYKEALTSDNEYTEVVNWSPDPASPIEDSLSLTSPIGSNDNNRGLLDLMINKSSENEKMSVNVDEPVQHSKIKWARFNLFDQSSAGRYSITSHFNWDKKTRKPVANINFSLKSPRITQFNKWAKGYETNKHHPFYKELYEYGTHKRTNKIHRPSFRK